MEVLNVSDISDNIKLEIKFNFLNSKLANTLKTSLEVDPEYSKEIKREFIIDESGNLNLSYESTAINLKSKCYIHLNFNFKLLNNTINLINSNSKSR